MNKVLIVDDDQDIRLLLDRFLSKNKFTPQTAADGETAIQLLKEQAFDLVLCDFKLPDINGLELIQKIKILRAEAAIIVITGYSDVKVAVQAIKLGAYDYVTKPLYPDEILLTIQQAIKSRTSRQQPPTEKESTPPAGLHYRRESAVQGVDEAHQAHCAHRYVGDHSGRNGHREGVCRQRDS